MVLPKIILFYAFTPLTDPEAVKLWQYDLCEGLGLKGRIVVAKQGINGTLGGDIDGLKKYIKKTKNYPGFKKIDFKWTIGTGNDFPRLQVRVKNELVSFGDPAFINVDENGVVGGGIHLDPYEVDKLVEERGNEVIFFDGRNSFEAKIGKFKNAIIPDIQSSHDFVSEIESGKYDHFKDKPIVTYCTGGIRCEILSAVMVQRGFKEVYQIDGGIVKYGEKFGDSSLWEGSLFTFDDRLAIDFSKKAKVIGECENCGAATKQFYNCSTAICHQLVLLCEPCGGDPFQRVCVHEPSKAFDLETIG